jgi:glycerate 2-kinase
MAHEHKKIRADALAILHQGLAAVDPATAVRQVLAAAGRTIRAADFSWKAQGRSRIILLGGGKAAGPMASAAEEILVGFSPSGLLVTKYEHSVPLRQVRLFEAGHPLPDANGLRGGAEILQLAETAGPKDLVLCLLSGGGSALLPAPVAGVTLAGKQLATDLLLRSGADIRALNTLRKHLSRVKGGGLARAAHPATLLTLAVSDVIGDPPEIIASGPTVPDPSTFGEALAIIHQYDLEHAMPQSVMRHLRRGTNDISLETWKPAKQNITSNYQVVAGIRQAADAACTAACKLGYRSKILTTGLAGEARTAAAWLVAQAREQQQTLAPETEPLCLIAGGETTVTVTGDGVGGRNQELALAAAIQLQGTDGITLLAAGTDGTDGPTDAAGALVDGTTWARGELYGLDATAYLANNDSYHYFDRLGDLVKTGPTRTNVMDLTLLLVHPPTPR